MIKDMTIVRKGLVIEVGSLKKSHVEGWVAIYTKKGERIGGFSLLDSKLKVIDKFTQGNTLFLTYSIKGVKQ